MLEVIRYHYVSNADTNFMAFEFEKYGKWNVFAWKHVMVKLGTKQVYFGLIKVVIFICVNYIFIMYSFNYLCQLHFHYVYIENFVVLYLDLIKVVIYLANCILISSITFLDGER